LTKNCPDRVASAEVTIGGGVGAVAVDESGGWVMGGYQRYEDYRDSGVEWLGEIPAHWDAKRFKFLITGSFQYGANEVAEIDDPELPRYIRITDVREDGSLRNDTFRSLPEHIAQNYLLEEGDILLARSGATVGKTFIYTASWGKAAYAGYLIRARVSDSEHSRFIYQFLQSNPYWEWVRSSFIQATIQNISAEKYANLWISVPPLEEQKSIARFLDYKTAQIDALIAKKESLLKKLAEKRSALISQAVTKGLDPQVPMKDSGVDWLGEIPAHWEAVRLRYCSEFVTSGSRGWAQYYSDAGSVFLRIANVSRSGIELKLNDVQRVIPPSGAEGDRAKAFPGDVIVSITADLGSVAYIPDDFEVAHVSQHLALLRPISVKVSSRWIAYSIFADVGKTQLLSSGYGGTKIQLNLTDVKDLWIALPPISEQLLIDQDIQKNIKTLTDLELRVEGAIKRLKEYRTALITNAVTGAIDVRNVPIPNNLQEAA
jgi:type I restriction enzyme, S subunit